MAGMEPPKAQFSIGDRVRVANEYFVAELQDAIGTIASPGETLRGHIGVDVYWVEFDELHPEGIGGIDAAAIEVAALRPA